MGTIAGKFADQDSYALTAIIQTSNNNQSALTSAILETDQLRATAASQQSRGLLVTLANPVPDVTAAATGTIGAALAGIGQAGTASQEEGGGGVPCPEISQFALVRSDINTPIPTLVQYIEKGMYLWNRVSGAFEKIIRADVVENIDLWAAQKSTEQIGVGSYAHPIIRSLQDTTGLALSKCKERSLCIGLVDLISHNWSLNIVDLKRKGTVKHLETAGPGHIYAAGSQPDKMLLWHNLKPDPNQG